MQSHQPYKKDARPKKQSAQFFVGYFYITLVFKGSNNLWNNLKLLKIFEKK